MLSQDVTLLVSNGRTSTLVASTKSVQARILVHQALVMLLLSLLCKALLLVLLLYLREELCFVLCLALFLLN